MSKLDLIMYEVPSISEYVSWRWLQGAVARYVAWKVDRKWDRYQTRVRRAVKVRAIKTAEGRR